MSESEALALGNIILYPTDTIWGLGCDATNETSVRRINTLKGRSEGKHLLILADSIEMLQHYVEYVPDKALQLITETEDPLTIIYPHAKNLPEVLIGEEKNIGIRIPRFPWLQDLIRRFGKPIVSTSANFSGMPSPRCFAEIPEKLKQSVDYISSIEHHTPPKKKVSKVIKIEKNGEIITIRG